MKKMSKGTLNILAIAIGIAGFIITKIASNISERLLDIRIEEKVMKVIESTIRKE